MITDFKKDGTKYNMEVLEVVEDLCVYKMRFPYHTGEFKFMRFPYHTGEFKFKDCKSMKFDPYQFRKILHPLSIPLLFPKS